MNSLNLPERRKESLKNRACKGEEITDDTLREMILRYYKLRGFDRRGQTDRKLSELGLE